MAKEMSAFVKPARTFEFLIQGVCPPCVLSDDDLKLFVAAARNIALTMIAGAITAIPTTQAIEEIKLAPYLGKLDAQGNAQGG